MTRAADVSVCIANFNGIDIIERCVASVVNQLADCEFEVLIFDDASEDGSAALIREQFPGIRCIFSDTNVGFSRASNELARIASGQFLLFLNNDAFLEPGALQLLWQQGQQHPAVLSLRQIDDGNGMEIDLGMGLDILTVPYPLHERDSPRLATVIGACLWVPRELFFRAKGFPEWFGSIGEDLYLCLFARFTGADVRVLADCSYRHISGHSFGGGKSQRRGETTNYRRRFLSERNRLYVTVLFFPGPLLLLLLPLWSGFWLAEAVVLSVATRSLAPASRIYGKAFLEVLRNARRLVAERRWAQQQKAVSTREFLRPLSLLPHKLVFLFRHGLPRLER